MTTSPIMQRIRELERRRLLTQVIVILILLIFLAGVGLGYILSGIQEFVFLQTGDLFSGLFSEPGATEALMLEFPWTQAIMGTLAVGFLIVLGWQVGRNWPKARNKWHYLTKHNEEKIN